MKKVLAGLLIGSIMLSGCSPAETDSEVKTKVSANKEEQPKRKPSEIKAKGDVIPSTEFEILKNDAAAYQNRPFEVPVEIKNVEKYSDHTDIRAEYKEPGDNGELVSFTLTMVGNQIDFEEGDYGYLSGVVADDVETEALAIMSVKGAFKAFEKTDELTIKNPNQTTIEVNQTLTNDYFSATVERIVKGDNFTVIFYTFKSVEAGKEPLNYAALKTYQNGQLIQPDSLSKLGVITEFEGHYVVYTNLDINQPFEVEIESRPDFMTRKSYAGKNIEPLVFDNLIK